MSSLLMYFFLEHFLILRSKRLEAVDGLFTPKGWALVSVIGTSDFAVEYGEPKKSCL